MINILTKDITIPEVQRLLQGGIAPRPIALVSTISKDGINNLSPFSFYNVFGANPPVIAFSPSRRGKDGSFKDTYLNIIESKECVVQAVTYSMVEQVSLASTEYEKGIDEFIKSGLTPIDYDLVRPKRVKESPFQMECKLLDMMSYGDGGASANIAICEVLKFHIDEDLFVNGIIQPDKINLVARMGGDFYCKAFGENIFSVEKPLLKKGIGYDQIPVFIKQSSIYTANNLGKFGNIESIPSKESVTSYIKEIKADSLKDKKHTKDEIEILKMQKDFSTLLNIILSDTTLSKPERTQKIEECAKMALESNQTEIAWKIALYAGNNEE